ncbi:MAG: hypothetical protein KDA52_06210 [Planctomycetaceae bacterium]|nr:hypothetical protein [Planctomycetaceae bacterium]
MYGIGEIKQTLDEQTLDDAMRKLVITSRLERPKTKAKRLVENREGSSCSHGLSNPLYSFILATQLGPSVTFEGLVNRFFDVCSQLKRLETIRALTVLGHGTVVWGFRNRDSKELGPALFMLEDMYEPIVPIYQPATELNPALFTLLGNIFLHLFHSVLAPEDVVIAYGSRDYGVKAPTSEEVCIPPDSDLIDSLNDVCDEQNPWHHSINLWSDKH